MDYEPFLPHQKYHKTSPPEFLTLTEEQEAVYQEVFKHFATEDYVIPGLKEGDGILTEEENFFLVSPSFILSRFISVAEDSNHLQTYECFLRWAYGTRRCMESHSLILLRRFLRATRWNAANCIKKLETTLKWRREYGIYDTLTVESIKEHVRTLRTHRSHSHAQL